MIRNSAGFTLIEVAFVLLIVAILLGYTVALFPQQQELKQYRAAQVDLDEIQAAIVGFAQVNGRLPCPSQPDSNGLEVFDPAPPPNGCEFYGGFVPVNTLGLDGELNPDGLLLDPWNNPYRYYVSAVVADASGDPVFVNPGKMRDVGLVDAWDYVNGAAGTDNYIDLDGQFVICTQTDADLTDGTCGAVADLVVGNPNGGAADGGPFAGAPFVLLSLGKNWSEVPVGDELANRGASRSDTDLGMGLGPSGNEYWLKDVVGNNENTFVRRNTGQADDFDDLVRWASPNLLFSKMIEADQLP